VANDDAAFVTCPRALGTQRVTGREAGGGIVGADLHDQLTADAVRLDDAPDR
jgi:hypothetical protein